MELVLEPLDPKQHDRSTFTCGEPVLDEYLKKQATQDVRRKANAVFVMRDASEPRRVLGFFTLCAQGLLPGSIPDGMRKHLSRYPQVSATLIGRLAICTAKQGTGLGAILLARALQMAHDNADVVGSSMVVVDAQNVAAAGFHRAHGFIPLPESNRLVMPMRTIAQLG